MAGRTANGGAIRQGQSARPRSGSLDSSYGHGTASHEQHAQMMGRHRMSPTEKVYASPHEATTALRAERAINPAHRPAPAAHVSRSRRHQEPITPVDASFNDVAVYDSDDEAPEGYEPAIRHMASHLSLRSTKSRVSFNDERLTRHGRDSSADGIRTQVIGAGNMQPNHRALSREMLRPAMRGSTSRLNLPDSNRADESDSSAGITPYPAHMRQSLQPVKRQGSDKALPHRPISMISPNVPGRASVMEDLHGVLSAVDRSDRQQSDFGAIHERHEQMATPPGLLRRKTRRDMRPREYDPEYKIQPTRPKLRNFLSSFSGLSVSQPAAQQINSDRRLPHDHAADAHIAPIHPAENMALYLHRACVPEWVDWPTVLGGNDSKRKGSAAKWLAGLNMPGGTGQGTHASMGWEWSRRLGEAIGNQQHGHGRRLGGWEGMRAFEQVILDCEPFLSSARQTRSDVLTRCRVCRERPV